MPPQIDLVTTDEFASELFHPWRALGRGPEPHGAVAPPWLGPDERGPATSGRCECNRPHALGARRQRWKRHARGPTEQLELCAAVCSKPQNQHAAAWPRASADEIPRGTLQAFGFILGIPQAGEAIQGRIGLTGPVADCLGVMRDWVALETSENGVSPSRIADSSGLPPYDVMDLLRELAALAGAAVSQGVSEYERVVGPVANDALDGSSPRPSRVDIRSASGSRPTRVGKTELTRLRLAQVVGAARLEEGAAICALPKEMPRLRDYAVPVVTRLANKHSAVKVGAAKLREAAPLREPGEP
jgi:hypothetical protein